MADEATVRGCCMCMQRCCRSRSQTTPLGVRGAERALRACVRGYDRGWSAWIVGAGRSTPKHGRLTRTARERSRSYWVPCFCLPGGPAGGGILYTQEVEGGR